MASLRARPGRIAERTLRRRLGATGDVARVLRVFDGETFRDLTVAIYRSGRRGGIPGERIPPRAGKGVRLICMVNPIRRCADHRPPKATCAPDEDAASVRRQAGAARPKAVGQ